MSGIAELCLRLGFAVSGCDLHQTRVTSDCGRWGAITNGHHPDHLGPELDAVIISSAVKFSNPEVAAARVRKIPVIPRAEMLGELLRMARLGVAVAGTHGKTTTTSLVGLILEEAGLDPTVAIGGNLRSQGTNVRLGAANSWSPRRTRATHRFCCCCPRWRSLPISIPSISTITARWIGCATLILSFINRVPFYGVAVLGLDSVNVRALLPAVRKLVVTYGEAADADLRAERIEIDGFSTPFEVLRNGARARAGDGADAGPPYRAQFAGCDRGRAGSGHPVRRWRRARCASLRGISRRFEIKGEGAGRIVLDDYAHHPAEVRATLATARAAFRRRVVVVFQPHRFTRLRDLFDEFVTAFDDADVLYLAEVYARRRRTDCGASPRGACTRRCAPAVILKFDISATSPTRRVRVAANPSPGDLIVDFGRRRHLQARRSSAVISWRRRRSPMSAFEQELRARFGARLRCGQALAALTSFRIGGPADFVVEVADEDELSAALAAAWRSRFRHFCLGAGTNILVSDRGVRGLVLQLGGSFAPNRFRRLRGHGPAPPPNSASWWRRPWRAGCPAWNSAKAFQAASAAR